MLPRLLASMNVRVLGNGSQAVAMAHGFGCTQSLWDSVLPSLLSFDGGSMKLILWDWPGSAVSKNLSLDNDGENEDEWAGHDCLSDPFHSFAQLLLKLLDELNVRSCVFVGHSMSAMVGCLAALQQPHRFSKLILVGASPRYINEGEYYGGFEREEVEQLYTTMSTNYHGWATTFAMIAMGDAPPPKVVETFQHTLLGMHCHVAIEMARAIFESDFRSMLINLVSLKVSSIPTVHFIHTTNDFVVPLVVATYMHHLVASSQKGSLHIVLPINGHFPQLTHPAMFTNALFNILNS